MLGAAAFVFFGLLCYVWMVLNADWGMKNEKKEN